MYAMDTSKLLLIFLVLMAPTITIFCIPTSENSLFDNEGDQSINSRFPQNKAYIQGGNHRFPSQELRAMRACDKYPRVCAAKGIAGPDCCKKKCVDVMSDRSNCGMCSKKCKYFEICCNGWCVNPSVDEKHCGKCNNGCRKGSSCQYGMCSYA